MNPTNSRLEIAFACSLSTVLPRVRSSSVHARAGSAGHGFMQRIVELQAPHPTKENPDAPGFTLEEARDVALGEVADENHREALRLIPESALVDMDLDPARCAVEVAFAYDIATDTARELGRGADRAYADGAGLTETEYAGTTDYLALVGSDGVRIRDYKMGWGKQVPAARNIQLRKCALDACRTYNRSWADVEILRAPPGVLPWYDRARLEPFDLDMFAAELRSLHDRTAKDRVLFREEGELPDAEVGDHCTYCDSARYCPAVAAVAANVCGDGTEMATLVRAGKEGAAALITRENAPRLLELYQRGKAALDVLDGALRIVASQDPIQMRDGRMWGPRPDRKRDIASVDLVKATIARVLGEPYVKAALSVEDVTLKGLEKAVRAYIAAQPGKPARGAIGKLDEALEQELAKAGALRIYQGATFTTFRPKDDES